MEPVRGSQTVDDFQRGFGPHTQEIMGDIPNHADQTRWYRSAEVLLDKG
jgi:hypothetical protein